MKIDVIKEGQTLIAKIMRNIDWPDGLTFYTDDSDFVQVSTWNYKAGKHLKAHSHKTCQRSSDKTQEVVFIKSGEMNVYFYTKDGKLIREELLKEGDVAVIYSGGHAYDIMKDKTQILEVKNGPYPGLDKDKHLIEE